MHDPSSPSWDTNAVGWPRIPDGDASDLFVRLLGDRSPRAIVGTVEAFVGVCTLLGIVFIGLGLFAGVSLLNAWLYHYPRVDRPTLLALTAAWAVAMTLAGRSAGFFLQALGSATTPVPLAIARRWLPMPTLARPIVAVWWLALAVAVMLASHVAAGRVRFVNPTGVERTIAVAVPVVLLYGSAFAVNTNLLIATAALTGSDAAVRLAWRLRLAVDVLLVALFLTVPLPAGP